MFFAQTKITGYTKLDYSESIVSSVIAPEYSLQNIMKLLTDKHQQETAVKNLPYGRIVMAVFPTHFSQSIAFYHVLLFAQTTRKSTIIVYTSLDSSLDRLCPSPPSSKHRIAKALDSFVVIDSTGSQ